MKAKDLFSLPTHLPFQDFFEPEMAPWEWVSAIAGALQAFDFLDRDEDRVCPPGVTIVGDVFIHPTVKLPPYAVIEGPTWIGPHTQIRPGAYIRGNVIVGEGCVLGHACEYKNCLLMDQVETAHFNYVGDSVLGSRSHLGAGAILANVRLDRSLVKAYTPTGLVETGLRKLGACLAEGVEVGCNAVLQPGTILSRKSWVGPATAFGGYLAQGAYAAAAKARTAHA